MIIVRMKALASYIDYVWHDKCRQMQLKKRSGVKFTVNLVCLLDRCNNNKAPLCCLALICCRHTSDC